MKISSKKCPKCSRHGMVQTARGWECIYCYTPKEHTTEEAERARRRRLPSMN